MSFDAEPFLCTSLPRPETQLPDGNVIVATYDGFYCSLCEYENFPKAKLDEHLKQETHWERVKAVREFQREETNRISRRNEALRMAKHRLDMLTLDRWKNEIKGMIFQYQEHGDQQEKKALLDLLTKYEHLERISLLEQSVWKHVCRTNPPNDIVADVVLSDIWFSKGWKEVKADMRSSNEIAIIMTQVLPFLGQS